LSFLAEHPAVARCAEEEARAEQNKNERPARAPRQPRSRQRCDGWMRPEEERKNAPSSLFDHDGKNLSKQSSPTMNLDRCCDCRGLFLVLLVALLYCWASAIVVVDGSSVVHAASSYYHHHASDTNDLVLPSEREVELAVELLRSIGVAHLCVPAPDPTTTTTATTHTTRRYSALPLCTDGCSRTSAQQQEHRFSSQLDEDDFYRFVDDAYQSEAEQAAEEAHDWKLTRIRNALLASVCILVAAVSSGLTVGIVGIDPRLLQIKIRAGGEDPDTQYMMEALLPLVQQRHRLLVTLLLVNSLSNECLPIFLDVRMNTVVSSRRRS